MSDKAANGKDVYRPSRSPVSDQESKEWSEALRELGPDVDPSRDGSTFTSPQEITGEDRDDVRMNPPLRDIDEPLGAGDDKKTIVQGGGSAILDEAGRDKGGFTEQKQGAGVDDTGIPQDASRTMDVEVEEGPAVYAGPTAEDIARMQEKLDREARDAADMKRLDELEAEGRSGPAESPAGQQMPAGAPEAAPSGRAPQDRDAEMARRNEEISERVRSGAPVKPWNPVFIAKRAKSMSKKARQIAAAAGLAAALAGLGICSTANSLVAPSQALPAGTAAPAPVPVGAQQPPARTPQATRTPSPVGAQRNVVVYVRLGGHSRDGCPAPGSVKHEDWTVLTVTNPSPGAFDLYPLEPWTHRRCGGTSFGLADSATPAIGAGVPEFLPGFESPLFRPDTTYSFENTEPDCAGNTCVHKFHLRVWNRSAVGPAPTSRP